MNRFLRLLPFLLLLRICTPVAPALAQNQPVSTRPFKGPPFTAFTNVTSTGVEACNSAVLDVRSYNSLVVRVTPTGGGTTEAAIFGVAGRYVKFCRRLVAAYGNDYHNIYAYYSEDGASNFFLAPFFNVAYVTSGILAASAVTVVVTPVPDTLIMATVGARAGLVTTTAGPTVIGGLADQFLGIGVPTAMNMGYPGALTTRHAWTGDVERCGSQSPNTTIASTADGSKVADINLAALSTTGQDGTDVTIQNVGTVVLYCKVASTSSAPTITSSNYRVALAAGSVAHDGTGGSVTFAGVGTEDAVYCLAASGTGAAAFFCR